MCSDQFGFSDPRRDRWRSTRLDPQRPPQILSMDADSSSKRRRVHNACDVCRKRKGMPSFFLNLQLAFFFQLAIAVRCMSTAGVLADGHIVRILNTNHIQATAKKCLTAYAQAV